MTTANRTQVSADVGPPSSDNPEVTTATMRRVATASFVGSVIEFYDFFIYGTAAALVFAKVFFPEMGAVAGTAAAFATLGVAFVARPLGSVIFGHYGDRVGRKKTLIASLLMMGIATVLVGLMPTTAQIGVAAPICLVVLRILQGLAAGGEWAGAALYATEYAPADKRGFWGMFPSLGGAGALILGNLTFLVTGFTMSDEAFVAYGWRIPFLASVILIAVGLYIRLKMDETPVFREQAAKEKVSGLPVAEAFRLQWKTIMAAVAMVIVVPTFNYTGASFLTNYGTSTLHWSRNFVLAIGVAGGFAIGAGIVVGAMWSDKIGRRRVIMTSAGVAVAWSVVLFQILDLRTHLSFAAGMVITMFIAGVAYGPMSAYMSELFHTRYRFTAAGFSYNFAQIIGGAIPPIVAAPIIASSGSFVFSLCIAGLCLVSLIGVMALPDPRQDKL